MASKKVAQVKMSNGSNCKKTTIGNGQHSKVSTNKRSTKKAYRGQGR